MGHAGEQVDQVGEQVDQVGKQVGQVGEQVGKVGEQVGQVGEQVDQVGTKLRYPRPGILRSRDSGWTQTAFYTCIDRRACAAPCATTQGEKSCSGPWVLPYRPWDLFHQSIHG